MTGLSAVQRPHVVGNVGWPAGKNSKVIDINRTEAHKQPRNSDSVWGNKIALQGSYSAATPAVSAFIPKNELTLRPNKSLCWNYCSQI